MLPWGDINNVPITFLTKEHLRIEIHSLIAGIGSVPPIVTLKNMCYGCQNNTENILQHICKHPNENL